MKCESIRVATLHDLLTYDVVSGNLFWKPRGASLFHPQGQMSAQGLSDSWNARHAGRLAFTAPSRDYKSGRILNIDVCAHRVIWAMQTGAWPNHPIDHIDGNKKNNAWSNLRAVTASENCKNKPLQRNSKSGVLGVRWVPQRRKWRATIGCDRKTVSLGSYDKFDEAVLARATAEKKLGFHENHGRKQ